MTSKILIALAAAGTCAWSMSAFAGGMNDAHLDTVAGVEVQTPASVNESAPQIAGGAHPQSSSTGFPESRDVHSDNPLGTGATSSVSGSGSVGSAPMAPNEATEYWLIGSESAESNAGSRVSERPGG